MERAEYLVPGQRRPNRYFRGLRITDFTDHHHIRILPQYGPQTIGEIKVSARPHRDLRYPWQFIFDRIFNRQYFFLRRVDPLKYEYNVVVLPLPVGPVVRNNP